jgi:hypothetical protein
MPPTSPLLLVLSVIAIAAGGAWCYILAMALSVP